MPRPYPPPPVPLPVLQPFTIGEAEEKGVAATLGMTRLTPEINGALSAAISTYKATAVGSKDTTVGNTLAALRELEKGGKTYAKALARLAIDNSGVDSITQTMMQPLAKAALENRFGARDAVIEAARERIKKLQQHKRVEPATESLRHFCGWLRVIFNAATPHLRQSITMEEAWRYCRRFALEVFTVAEIERTDFITHPERLTEYLGTDVSPE